MPTSIAASFHVETLAESLPDPADPVILFALIGSPDPLEVKRGLDRYAALYTCEFSAYESLLEKLRSGEFEAIDHDMRIMGLPSPERWGHRWF